MLLSALFQKLQPSSQDSECRPLLQLLQQSSQSVHDAYICTDCKQEPDDFKAHQFFSTRQSMELSCFPIRLSHSI